MLAYARKFTYLSAAKNSNKEYLTSDMAKVNIKSEKITPFGGIYYASKAFYALSLDKVINGTLGVRSSTYNGYQWDEICEKMKALSFKMKGVGDKSELAVIFFIVVANEPE